MRISTTALACALAAPLSAQMVWTQVSNVGPPPRDGHAVAFDAARQCALLFGGRRYSSGVPLALGDTWQWNGSTWMQVSSATSPTARFGHAMAYDSARQRIVLFGGESGAVLGDTWEWDGTDWTRASTVGPSPRTWHAMAYDAVRDRVVLFGGSQGFSLSIGETWEWDGIRWTQASPATSPAGRYGHAMAYDASRHRTTLFGGWGGGAFPWLGDTWEWDGVSWQQVSSTGPRRGDGAAMAYDVRRERLVVYGGESYNAETWEWDGASWSPIPANHAGGRAVHAMAYDAAREEVLMFGGSWCGVISGCFYMGDTWTYRPTVRGTTAPIGFGCAGSAGTPTLGAVGPPIVGNRDFALEIGAVPPNASVFLGLSTELAATPLPPCWVYPRVPFLDVLSGTASAGTAEISLAIPWIASLSGADLFVQGGALDPQGALLGLASLTPGMQIRIGD